MNWLIKNFLRGLVIVVPIALTVYLLYEVFVWIDRLLNLKTPGAGFAITIVAIIAIGAVASNFFVRKFLQLADLIFTRAPIVRLIYSAIRDLSIANSGLYLLSAKSGAEKIKGEDLKKELRKLL